MTLGEILTILALTISGVGVPIIGGFIGLLAWNFRDVRRDVRHTHDCLHRVELMVAGNTITRGDVDGKLLQQREQVDRELHGLHERILILEGRDR